MLNRQRFADFVFFEKGVDVQNAWCNLRGPFSGGGHQRREALKNFFELFSKRG